MTQYIPQDALVAEIKRRISQLESEYKKLANLEIWITAKEIEHKINGLKEALSIVSTLEMKEVDDELQGIEKEVAEAHVARIDRKRIPIELKGEIKAKFKNEFNTMWQIVNGLQFANVAKYIIERICLHFAAWGAYNLKGISPMDIKAQKGE